MRYSLSAPVEVPAALRVERQWLVGFVPELVVGFVGLLVGVVAVVSVFALAPGFPVVVPADFVAAWPVAVGGVAAVVVAAPRTVVVPVTEKRIFHQQIIDHKD